VSHFFQQPHGKGFLPTLDNVSFDVAGGEFLSIVGPSGCGKTTLLNMIEGLITPQRGRVLIGDVPVNRVQAGRAAYMFARDNLLPWRRVLGNVELAMEMGGRKPSRDRAMALLDTVGLRGFESHYPSQLSQGMRQRVALARTLAVEADVWLMDEPFAALDAYTRTTMQSEFTRIWEMSRKTVVLVTHDLVEAVVLADRVVVMSKRPGKIRDIHTIDLPRPRNVLDLHARPEFFAVYQELWNQLRETL
jgi:NitT/TauT family transport system ATP-binding protein